MKGLFTIEEYDNARSRDLLKCECYQCSNGFFKEKRHIKNALDNNKPGPKYCSQKCLYESRHTGKIVNCAQCSKEIYRNKKWLDDSVNHFCSKSCSATFNNTGLVKPQEVKKKISNSLTGRKYETTILKKDPFINECIGCHNKFETRKKKQKYCNQSCSRKYASSTPEAREKQRQAQLKLVREGKHQGWQSRGIRSYPEKFFETVLINNNIEFKAEHKIKKSELGFDCISNYFLDFYIPEHKIDLEIDGKQHKVRKAQDEIRDQALESAGISVYRIKWKNPNTDENKAYIKQEIDNFLIYLKDFGIRTLNGNESSQ